MANHQYHKITLLVAMLLLSCTTAVAQDNLFRPPTFTDETNPAYKQSVPSSEMDFSLPDEAINSNSEPATKDKTSQPNNELLENENAPEFDQFFSSTKIIDANDNQKSEPILSDQKPKVEEKPKEKPKKVVKKAPKLPDFNFKTVNMPLSIYHRPNTHQNRHLPNAYFKKDWRILLSNAIKADNLNELRALKINGANVLGDDENGVPLLILAARMQKLQSARWLLMQGYDPNTSDEHGFTAMHYAAFSGNNSLISLLKLYGADQNIVDNQGYAPKYYAEKAGYTKLFNNN
jgi:hypothetical protein